MTESNGRQLDWFASRNGLASVLCAGLLLPAILMACSPEATTPPAATGGRTGSSGGSNGSTGGTNGGRGGASGGTGGNGAAASCPDAPMRLNAGCSGGQCHNPDNAGGITDVATIAGLAGRLINVEKKIQEDCNGQTKLVNPTKPASGVLFERLSGDRCGLQMPPLDARFDQQLTPTQRADLISCLKAWLEPQLQ